MTKKLENKIESITKGNLYTVKGQGARRHSNVNVTMSDGLTTRVNRDVNKGALVDGSNSYKKNRVTVASLMIQGMNLEDAVFTAYANHGYTVVDGVRYVRGRDHAFRMNGDNIETFNVTIDETDHRYGWRVSASIAKAVPDMEQHEKAKATKARSDNGKAHNTQGAEYNRNQCLIQYRNNGALKAKKA